uniref:Putative secreted protein n=1 Tax=Anopheles marajoara TaxID=58244 RepID=A0A2M4CCC0_9DIPT
MATLTLMMGLSRLALFFVFCRMLTTGRESPQATQLPVPGADLTVRLEGFVRSAAVRRRDVRLRGHAQWPLNVRPTQH